jgi:hypothetical protein
MVRRWLSRFEGRIAVLGKPVFPEAMARGQVGMRARIPKETRAFETDFRKRFMAGAGFSAQILLVFPN